MKLEEEDSNTQRKCVFSEQFCDDHFVITHRGLPARNTFRGYRGGEPAGG